MVSLLAAVVGGYLLGSLPVAALAARLRGASIFDVGSGNMGAMNTARNLGYGLGAIVLVLDVAKGGAAVLLGLWLARAGGLAGVEGLAAPHAAGVAAVLGHAWSPWVGFRGGKALATALGISLPVYPSGGLYGLALLVALALVTRKANLAVVVTMLLYPFLVLGALLREGAAPAEALAAYVSVVAVAVIVLLKHRRPITGDARAARRLRR